MGLSFETNQSVTPEQAADIYNRSGLSRPKDLRLIQNMIEHANVIVTAWDGEKLVGFLRAMTDFSFDCYLNDLAVDKEYQHIGVGRELVKRLKELLDDNVLIFLISAPDAAGFYEKLEFQQDFARVGQPWCLFSKKE